jgi:hypothetical protein
MSQPIFNQVCLDPTLIKGIYHTCDQWCMSCPATARCLAYRCRSEIHSGKQDIYKKLADRLYEGMMFMKRLCAAEGSPTPELDELLANDPREQTVLAPVDDPLERMGRRYANLAGNSYCRAMTIRSRWCTMGQGQRRSRCRVVQFAHRRQSLSRRALQCRRRAW